MKRLTLLLAILMATVTGMSLRAEKLPIVSPEPQDTIFIKLPNGAAMNLIVKNTAQLKMFKQYQLDSLMHLLSGYVEQVEKMEKSTSNGNSKDVTVTFHPAKDLKDPNAPEEINITISAQNLKNNGKDKSNGLEEAIKVYIEYKEKKRQATDTDSVKAEAKKAKANRRTSTQFNVDLGLNSFVNAPGNSGDLYDLRPLGSRFVNLAQYYRIRLGSQHSPFYLKPGLELTFNNYMFDKNNYLVDDNGVAKMVKETTRSFEKSKLATSALNASLMPELRFREKSGKDGFKIAAGGFVGYRLGSHTKLKYQLEGDTEKEKERSSYNLENFQYGVNFSIGYRKFELFTKYNLNDLFKENRGPKMNVISFGFRI